MTTDSHFFLNNLNPEQLRACKHGAGPLIIFAGAGSGKTRVLTRRIVNLISEHAVHPSEILAVTFTNKAAAEMRERISKLFAASNLEHNSLRNLWVYTFHACCLRILRVHAETLGFSKDFVIYDTSDSLSALKRVYKRLKVDPKFLDPRSVMRRIDKAKNNYEFYEDVRTDKYMPREHAEITARLYEAYQEELQASNAMDFGDLISNVITLFKLDAEVLTHYQERFKYLLIDEYQDTNKVQYMLVKMLAEKYKNICVVGDDDQSIYAFRGATIDNILNFKKDYPEAEVITLDTNYRSTKNILKAANSVISKNLRREKKRMKTDNPIGEGIINFRGYSEKDEARFIVQEVSKLLSQGRKMSEFAVFYRTNAQSRAIEEALCEYKIAYEIYGGHKFYERKEIKDLLCYFRLILNRNDNEAFLRVVNTPARGLGASSVGKLSAYAEEIGLSLFKALEKVFVEGEAEGLFGKGPASKFRVFHDIIQKLRIDAKNTAEILKENEIDEELISAMSNLLKTIAEKSGYISHLKKQDSIEAESRLENIEELLRVAYEFVAQSDLEDKRPRLGDFLDRASLSSGNDAENTTVDSEQKQTAMTKKREDSVSLMTLHLAKGLEFNVVFLVGLEEGLLPHVRSIDDPRALEEERRLCYVGITRAKKRLYLTRASQRQSFGQSHWYTGVQSRFLRDIPEEVLGYSYGG